MKCFKCISGYNIHSDINYIDTQCFKIIAQDSHDEVINSLGGLKNGITKRLVERSAVQNHFTMKDVDDFIDSYSSILEVRKEIVTLFKHFDLKLEHERLETPRNLQYDNYNRKISDKLKLNPLDSLAKSDSNITKSTSSNGFRFKTFSIKQEADEYKTS